MKKSLLCLLLLSCLVLLTGCKEKQYQPLPMGDKFVKPSEQVEEKKDEIVESKKELSYVSYVTTQNDIVVIVKNTTEETIDITVNIKYLNGYSKSINNAHETVYAIKPNKETTVVFKDIKEWDNFDVTIDYVKTTKQAVYDSIKYTNKTNKKNVEIEVKNYSKDPIDGISFSIAYYGDDNELVGFVRSDTISIEGDVSGIVTIDYPKNKYNRNISFNRYVIYLNEVYKNKKD